MLGKYYSTIIFDIKSDFCENARVVICKVSINENGYKASNIDEYLIYKGQLSLENNGGFRNEFSKILTQKYPDHFHVELEYLIKLLL